MTLNYIELGEGQPVVILHGLFGSLDNWMTIARRFAENYKSLSLINGITVSQHILTSTLMKPWLKTCLCSLMSIV